MNLIYVLSNVFWQFHTCSSFSLERKDAMGCVNDLEDCYSHFDCTCLIDKKHILQFSYRTEEILCLSVRPGFNLVTIHYKLSLQYY